MAAKSLRFENAAGLVVQDCMPVGPGGGAWLCPTPNIELIFDRLSGDLCYLAISGGAPGGSWTLSEQTATFLNVLCGRWAPDRVQRVAATGRAGPELTAEAALSSSLSALARLRAARATSPVPTSPWWDAQEAELAQEARLHDMARVAAAGAVRALAALAPPQLSERQAAAALSAADIAGPDESAAVASVRGMVRAAAIPADQEAIPADEPMKSGPEQVAVWHMHQRPSDPGGDGMSRLLDLTLTPAGLFLPSLWPEDDLIVQADAGGANATVSARLAPTADMDALRQCRARLVVPAQGMLAGHVLAESPFTVIGRHAVAKLGVPLRGRELDGTWIEIVSDEFRPVLSAKRRRIKRALRWADAALRGEQRPHGLAPSFSAQDWMAFAAIAWQRCRDDWNAAGDPSQAQLAARLLEIIDPDCPVPPSPSAPTAELGGQESGHPPASIAEECGQ